MLLFRESKLAPGCMLPAPPNRIPDVSQLPLPEWHGTQHGELKYMPIYIGPFRRPPKPDQVPTPLGIRMAPHPADVPEPIYMKHYLIEFPVGIIRRILEFEQPVGARTRRHLPPWRFQ